MGQIEDFIFIDEKNRPTKRATFLFCYGGTTYDNSGISPVLAAINDITAGTFSLLYIILTILERICSKNIAFYTLFLRTRRSLSTVSKNEQEDGNESLDSLLFNKCLLFEPRAIIIN